jgi:Protein of unknown function (DUF1326)
MLRTIPLALAPLALALAGSAPDAPRGGYVEARTAAVYAGACHYGGQVTTQGREAVLAWSFDGGRAGGVSLAGVDVVCALAAPANLDQPGPRRSVIYVSASAPPAAREAAVALVRERCAALLGEVRAVLPCAVSVSLERERYTVRAGKAVALEGRLLPDEACCTMPLAVWYAPLAPEVLRPRVGESALARCAEPRLGPPWERLLENDALAGRFAFGPEVAR